MSRSDYWLRIIMTYVTIFVVAFIIAIVNNGMVPDGVYALIQAAVICYFWFIGYERCQDAGIHGFWAFFTPSLIGMIVLGCFKTKVKLLEV